MKKSAFKFQLLFLLFGLLFSFLGCSSDNASSSSGNLSIVHMNADTEKIVGEDTIDHVEIVGHNADGNQVYGPVREAFSSLIVRDDVPRHVKSITVDYLRNNGYPLKVVNFDTEFENNGLHIEINPTLQAHETPRSVWTSQLSKNCLLKVNDTCFKIKGICYSPSPINYDASAFPALGDLFWDSFKSGGSDVWNWYSLWGSGALYDNFYARDDLTTIRGLGANTIRLYAVMSRQPIKVGAIYPFPDDPTTSGNHFTHKMFLDQCYNNGVNPVYVLIGIPMAKPLFQKGLTLQTNEQKFWENILNETTRDLANHPAVLGFTIMNEEDAEPWSHTTGVYTGTDKTDHFYSQAISYAKIVKANAPDKLVGWALHDCPQLLRFAANTKFTEGDFKDKLYLEELAKAFDFWGVNTYQSTHFNSVLGDESVANGYTYSQIPTNTKKPVIFTELGWPASGRTDSGSIIYNDTTGANTAAYISRMLPLAYGEAYTELFAGAFYFEFSDEWWKSGNTTSWNTTSTASYVNSWPNKYDDQEGYGLFSIKRGTGKQNTDPIWGCNGSNGPCQPIDEMVPRLPLTNALSNIYKNLP